MEIQGLISADDAAAASGYTLSHLRRLFLSGKIQGHQAGRRCTLYDPASLAAYQATAIRHGAGWIANPEAAKAARVLSGRAKARKAAARLETGAKPEQNRRPIPAPAAF